MKTINMGCCCIDCFDVINETESATDQRKINTVKKVMLQENLHSIHTGEEIGFSWSKCDICRSPLGGTRWEVYGLQ
jgi:hypothetical protein